MSFESALRLIGEVQIARETISFDGMGGMSVSTALTTLTRAAIWQAGSSDSFFSDQILTQSSHVLACKADADVLFTDKVVYGGSTYEITGRPDDVLFLGGAKFVPLRLVN